MPAPILIQRMRNHNISWRRACLLIGFALSAAGCASSAGITHDQTMRDPAELGARAEFNAWPTADWWKQLNDEELGHLIELALHENPGIAQAAKQIEKAAAYADSARSTLAPQVTGALSVSRQRLSENAFYPPPYGGSHQTLADASLNANWDLDFWGRNRSALDAALSQTRAAVAEQAATRLMISVAVARTYYQLAHQLDYQALAEQALQQRGQELDLVEARLRTGLDSEVEQQQAQSALASAKVDLQAAQEAADLTRNALAALTAQPAQALRGLDAQLSARPPQTVPDDIPVDLLGRRPDLAAAKARVEAAGANIREAHAEFYPNVSLSAFIGLSSFGLSKFLDLGSGTTGIGPALHLPVFDAGRLRANLRVKNADYDLAVTSYNQTLLEALHDIADQITSLKTVQRQTQDQQIALQAAEHAYQLAQARYKAGLSNYLSVLSAEDGWLRERGRDLDLRARGLDLNLSLIKSLGGGYAAPETKAAANSRGNPNE